MFIAPRSTSRTLLVLVGMLLLVWLLLQTSPVQNFLVGKVTARLSKDLNTEVKVQDVSFSFFDKVDLNGILIRDKQKDTLLYAGTLKLRITDWFFLKSKTNLKYIGLEDAFINMQRSDSIWNFQFIVDHFSSPPAVKDTAPSKPITLDIKKIDFKKVTFLKNDEWVGQKMLVKVGSMLLDAEKTDINTNTFLIDSIELDRPYFSIENFTGHKPPVQDTILKDTGLYFNSANLLLKAGSVKITNGTFASFKRGEVAGKGFFDAASIKLNKINGVFQQVSFIEDTIRAKINLSVTERSGFDLKKLKANFKLTPQIMELAQLDLQTPKSRLGNYYAMHFHDFKTDMSGFIERVVIDANFRNAVINSDDIAFFAPSLTTWNQEAFFSGTYHGTISNFKVENLFLRTSANTYAYGELSMRGLPDINKTVINFSNANIQTNNKEIAFIYPAIQKITSPDLSALGNTKFVGNFSGTISDFKLNGNVSTNLGGLNININLKLPKQGDPYYKGNIQTAQFEVGKFLDVASLGRVSFKGQIEGKSFELDKARTTLNGTFNTLEFNHYTYSSLIFNGAIEKKKFSGDFKANDPNFDFTSTIQVDLGGVQPSFNILGDLSKANFQKLNFIKENFQLTALFDLNFTGRNIDAFLGSAKIFDATLIHDSTRLDFDSLTINATYDSINKKVLNVESNQFDLTVAGQYNILDLPNSFQTFLSRYYPAYIHVPETPAKNQKFTVTVNTKEFSKYANVINAKLSGLDSMRIVGSVNTNYQDSGFYLLANIPNAKFDKYKLEDAVINGIGNFDSLELTGEIGRIYLGDSLFFPNSHLNIYASNDHSILHLSTRANETLNDADLNAEVITLQDGVHIDFQPSSFVLNTNKWQLEKEGELIIRKNFASAKNVKFSQGIQEITIKTEEEDGSNTSNLIVKLKDLNMGDFIPLFTKKPRIEGSVNGNIFLRDFYNKFYAEASITANQFRLDNDSIGTVRVTANYDSKIGKVVYTVESDNDKYTFNANGSYNLKDSAHAPLLVNLNLNNTKISVVNQFLNNIFSEIDGLASGDLTIQGNPGSPDLLGQIAIKDAALTVNFTQVRYNIDTAFFIFNKGSIDFGTFTIRDKYNNTASVKGILYETGFKNMRYNFDMVTEKLLLLDTKGKDNQQFYGHAIGYANLSLTGPQSNMRMSITAGVNDTTHIFIPTTSSKESTEADFIVFKKNGTEIEEITPETDTKLSIDLDITANTNAQIDVILDQITGDVINATGNGRIRISIPANGNMTMNGRYDIENGKYNFNFQSFLRKPFVLKENAGNYIEWNGDPYKAELRIDAQYIAKNISFNDLISNTGFDLGGTVRGYRGDVYVVANLTGKLTNPEIQFSFGFPAGSPIENDNTLKLFLDKVQNDDNEMLKQVTWLIVFGSFTPYGEIGSGGGNIARSAGLNTISQKITGELNKLVSTLLSKITGDKSLQFDVSTSTYSSSVYYGNKSSGNNQLDRQRLDLRINQSLLNGKVIITFGTGLDFNISSSAVQSGNFQWLPDISVQIILSRDRKLRGIIFNKSSLDVSSGIIGRRTRQGVSISYSFDFPKDKPPPVTTDSVPKLRTSASRGALQLPANTNHP